MSITTVKKRPVLGTAALWVLQVLLAIIFVFVAVPKVLGDPNSVAPFDLIGVGTTGMIVVGYLELLGAIALFIPRLVGLAALFQIPLMIGATVLSAIVTPDLVVIPAVTLICVLIVAWFRREDVTLLFNGLRHR